VLVGKGDFWVMLCVILFDSPGKVVCKDPFVSLTPEIVDETGVTIVGICDIIVDTVPAVLFSKGERHPAATRITIDKMHKTATVKITFHDLLRKFGLIIIY
jgi:hypothetical protein